MTRYAEKILNALEPAVAAIDVHTIKPLPVDRWLGLSCLQKSIRRNLVKEAQRAALTVWLEDKQAFWRRISLICLEDCGVAAVDVVVQTLKAFNAPAWRAQNDDLKVALYLVERLCTAPKIRLCDEIYILAGSAPEYRDYRYSLVSKNDNALSSIVLNDRLSLPKRAIALWLLAGYRGDHMPERIGSLDAATEALCALKASRPLTEACIAMLRKSRYPLALLTPLLCTQVQRQEDGVLTHDEFLKTPIVSGIPLAALDGFTRIGKSCFSEMRSAIPELKGFSIGQVSLAVFYAEGKHLDKRFTSKWLEECQQVGEFADIEANGLCIPSYLPLRETIANNLPLLNDIRQKQLKAILREAA